MGMLTVKEVAEYLSVSHAVVYDLVQTGQLRAIRIGPRLFRFTQDSLDVFIASNTVKTTDDVLRSVLSDEAADMVLRSNIPDRATGEAL